MMTAEPARNPCGSCPYRCDVPAGIWAEEEYDKLPEYDKDTGEQPIGAFFCHQQNGRLCAGWVGCHDMGESLGLRFALSMNLITEKEYEAALTYQSAVALFGSGAEAAEHGRSGVAAPDEKANRAIGRLMKKRERIGDS